MFCLGTDRRALTYVVCLLFVLVPLLVGGGLSLIWCTLLLTEGLPPLTEEPTNLTKRDAGVFLAHVLALLIGKEHVSRKTPLGSVGVCGSPLAKELVQDDRT
jgi:hypothetical protein